MAGGKVVINKKITPNRQFSGETFVIGLFARVIAQIFQPVDGGLIAAIDFSQKDFN